MYPSNCTGLTEDYLLIREIEEIFLARNEGSICVSDNECQNIDCSKYDTPVKEGYKPYCIENKCACLCGNPKEGIYCE